MSAIKFIDKTSNTPVAGEYLYIWDASSRKLIGQGQTDGKGVFASFDKTKRLNPQGQVVLVYRSFVSLDADEVDIQLLLGIGSTSHGFETVKLVANTALTTLKPPPVDLYFYHFSNAQPPGDKRMTDFVEDIFRAFQLIWTPKERNATKFTVALNLKMNRRIEDAKNEFKRIDVLKTKGSPQMLRIVQTYHMTSIAPPSIPVFLCHAAWDETKEGDPPREGSMRGYTLTKRGTPWFKNDRAIFLFSGAGAAASTLAHEMKHWCGYSHNDMSASDWGADRGEFRSFYKWATVLAVRQKGLLAPAYG